MKNIWKHFDINDGFSFIFSGIMKKNYLVTIPITRPVSYECIARVYDPFFLIFLLRRQTTFFFYLFFSYIECHRPPIRVVNNNWSPFRREQSTAGQRANIIKKTNFFTRNKSYGKMRLLLVQNRTSYYRMSLRISGSRWTFKLRWVFTNHFSFKHNFSNWRCLQVQSN